ncbi:MAG: hypothetical protein KJN79_07535, partial [Gammaproteobacteria bacterium]|nr:hypothetical protein [Gammaproteobacteria bacterium]
SDDILTCWPTKLAFAPRVSELVMSELHERGIDPSGGKMMLPGLPRPALALLPWDEVTQWS